MAAQFRSATHQRTSSQASLAATEPAGAAEGDILLYYLDYYEQYQDFVSGPSGGWTLLNTWTGTTASGRLYWIRRGASAPGLTTTVNNSSGWIEVIVVAVSGAPATSSPIDAAAYSTTGTANPPDPNPPSITTTGANTLVLAVGMGWTGWTAGGGCVAPSGYTLCTTPESTDDAAIAYKSLTAAATEDPGIFDGQGSTSNEWHAATLAVRSASDVYIETSNGYALVGSSPACSLTLTNANKLIAFVGEGRNPPPGSDPTSVTWGAQGLTKVGTYYSTVWGQVWIYYLDNPTAGAADLTANFGDSIQHAIAGAALLNAASGAPAYGGGSGDSTTPSATVAGSVNGDLLLGVTFTDDNAAFSARSGTSIYETTDIQGNSNFGAQYATAAGSSGNLNWTIVTNPWAAMAIAVSASGSVAPTAQRGAAPEVKIFQPIMTGFAS